MRLAGFLQGGEASGLCRRSAYFFEHGSEDGEVSALLLGAVNIGGFVAGDSDARLFAGGGARST